MLSFPEDPQSLLNTKLRGSETFRMVHCFLPYHALLDIVAYIATQTILSKIPPNNSKLTYVWEQYLFHYISEGGFTFLVMADDSVGR
jgi:hypothetical protein